MKKPIAFIAFCLFVHNSFPQIAAFNQNDSRSNRNSLYSDSWNFDLSAGASFGINSDEKSLFRGNSMATKISGRYQFGRVGLGISSGLVTGSINESAINSFLTERKIDPSQTTINTAKPSNSYLLFGPSFRFGNRIQLMAELQGGMFLNDPGSVTITPTGAQRPVYGYTGSDKNLFPGFSGALQMGYPINGSTSFFINTDYLYTTSSVRLLDLQSGIDIPTEQKRDIQLFTAGIGISKTFGSRNTANGKKHIGNVKYEDIPMTSRDQASGQSTGRRQSTSRDAGSGLSTGRRILPDQPTVVSPRDAASGLPTGRRTYQPGQPVYGNRTYQPGQPVYGNITRQEPCGAVTQKVTHPDGTMEENTFACPDDALQYARGMNIDGGMPNRISMNVTVPKQTQGATFGEKVNQGLHAAGSALSQRSARKIISGRLTAGSADNNPAYAIVTNNTTRGGSATMNSQTSSTRTTQNTSFGTMVRNGVATGAGAAAGAATINVAPGLEGYSTKIFARDVSSGQSSGKRSSREKGSGLATGRRQYQPVFFEGDGVVCNPCAVNVTSNPLYKDNGMSGSNPLYEQKNRTTSPGTDDDCDGVAGVDVYLLDPESRAVVAKTITGACGEYWFANVPSGDYILKVAGALTIQKRFDIMIDNTGKQDVAGEIVSSADSWSLQINTSTDEENTKASINTTRSNIKRVVLIKSDSDGDGIYESFRAIGTFADGTSGALSVSSVGKVTLAGGGGGAAAASYARTGKQGANLIGINLADNFTVTANFSDGSTKDITEDARVSHHPNVVQFVIDTEDSDGDGFADAVSDQKIKTKSNIKNDRVAAPDNENEDEIWSPRSNLKSLPMQITDVDGDGRAESIVGGFLPGGSVISSAIIAGTPIGGIIVKGGKNPGGALRTTQTNGYGEFEFTEMEPGTHTITTEQYIIIDDETFISSGDATSQQRAQDHNSSRSNKSSIINNDGGSEAQQRSQDHNSSRSNKSGINDNGGGGDPQQRSQDHNSSRSNKSGINDDGGGNDPSQRAQNNNTVRSNRTDFKSVLIEADIDGDGEYETDISSSHSYTLTADEKGNTEPQQKAGISTSRSNIRTKSSLQPLGNDLYIVYGTTIIKGKEVAIQSVLKTKHDTAKNSVGNIR